MRDGVLRKDNEKSLDTDLPNKLLKAKQEIYDLRQRLKRAQDENKVLKKAERIFPEKK